MKRFSFCAILLLSACSYVQDTSVQRIKIVTPGADNTICYAYVEDLRYKVIPPNSISVNKSPKDLVVDCRAPGNRQKKVIVASKISNTVYQNVGNAGIGALWDGASGASYKYPDIVEVNFKHSMPVPESMPAQNSEDVIQPENYLLEEFSPGLPRLNADRHMVTPEIRRRESGVTAEAPADNAAQILPDDADTGTSAGPDKGNLESVPVAPASDKPAAEQVSEQAAPASEDSTEKSDVGAESLKSGLMTPVPLYPGQ